MPLLPLWIRIFEAQIEAGIKLVVIFAVRYSQTPNLYSVMRAKKFICILCAAFLLMAVPAISCESVFYAKMDKTATVQQEDFKSFLEKFTGSASFQYTRVKFPLKTPIVLLEDDEETERTFPFTREKWPLLDSETMKEERITREESGIYVSKFTVDEPKRKVFEAGYEESEIELRVEFEMATDGKWYVTDCYTGWYGYDLPINELQQTIQQVKEENAIFKELHP